LDDRNKATALSLFQKEKWPLNDEGTDTFAVKKHQMGGIDYLADDDNSYNVRSLP